MFPFLFSTRFHKNYKEMEGTDESIKELTAPAQFPFKEVPGLDSPQELTFLSRFVDFTQTFAKPEEEFQTDQKPTKSKVLARKGIFNPRQVTVKATPVQKATTPQQKAQPKKPLRETSVTIKGDWNIVAELAKQNVDRLSYNPGSPENLGAYSSVLAAKRIENINPKRPAKVNTSDEHIYLPGTTTPAEFLQLPTAKDPVFQEIIESGQGSVFITDLILSTLMNFTRAVYPWDVVVEKTSDGKIIFEKSEDSMLDQLTVNENAAENMPDEEEPENSVNNPKKLWKESIRINKAFQMQAVKQPEFKLGEPHPSQSPQTAPFAYNYRKWKLGEDTYVVVRSQVDSYIPESSNALSKVVAVNEYDARITGGYRRKLEAQRGQVLAMEFKNNSCKMSKWAAQALLSGVEYIKVGFFSREKPNTSTSHELLGVSKFRTADFASQLNLNLNSCWGTFRAIVDIFKKAEPGKYTIVKDPYKPMVRVYSTGAEKQQEEKF